MEIYLIRHTKPNIPEGVCYGSTDMELIENSNSQFEKIKTSLNIDESFVFYSSPLKRCSLMAKYLSNDNFIIDNRLKEISFGKWEETPWVELPLDEFEKWSSDFVNNPTPGNESFIELQNRVVEFYNEVLKLKHDKIVIVSHAGNIRALISYILAMPLTHAFRLEISLGGVTKINANEIVATVEYINN
ncbi:MAG: alpha-ribazole phosphatase [Bacteroidota bacterium]